MLINVRHLSGRRGVAPSERVLSIKVCLLLLAEHLEPVVETLALSFLGIEVLFGLLKHLGLLVFGLSQLEEVCARLDEHSFEVEPLSGQGLLLFA